MIKILQANIREHIEIIHQLFGEYLRWVCPKIYQEYKAEFDAESVLSHDMETINIFFPPQGILLLAYEDDKPAGCACVRTIGNRIAEVKRMYVRSDFRRKGIGMALVQECITRVRDMKYSEMRLDSAGFMLDAHRVYKSAGFLETTAYEGSEIPEEYRKYWVFMKLDL